MDHAEMLRTLPLSVQMPFGGHILGKVWLRPLGKPVFSACGGNNLRSVPRRWISRMALFVVRQERRADL